MVNIKYKKLSENAITPHYSREGDAAIDFYASEEPKREIDQRGYYLTFKTDIAMEIPSGHAGFIFPRSSICKTTMVLTNSVGIIDENYRGEIKAVFRDSTNGFSPKLQYKKGDKIFQMIIMPIPKIELQEVEELSETNRGENGFGSSDKS